MKYKNALIFLSSLCMMSIFANAGMTSASADSGNIYTGSCGAEGDNITWTYNDETRTMTFSGTGKMDDNVNIVDSENPEWLNLDVPYRAIHVVFEEGITGVDWFDGYFCNVDTFGDETGSLTIAESVKIDDPLWQLLRTSGVYEKITFHGVYGSSFWEGSPMDKFIGEGYSENPVLNITGNTTEGAEWVYTYENAVIYISGNGTVDSTDFGKMPFEKSRGIVIGKNVSLPESDTDRTSLFTRYFAQAQMFRSNQEIFMYPDSPALNAYNETMNVLKSDGIENPESEHPYTLVNEDVNENGSVGIEDATDILSVYAQNAVGVKPDTSGETNVIYTSWDRKNILSDIDGNGNVNLTDATLVLKYYAESAAGISSN